MRKDESQKVVKALEVLGLHLKVVDSTDTFLNATTKIREAITKSLGVTVHPEEKRKIIGIYSFVLLMQILILVFNSGDTFMHVAQKEIADWGLSADEVYP